MLLWTGAVGAVAFPAVFLGEGWWRRDYSSLRHTVSALATGPRGWVQTVNFVLCGLAITLGAVGLAHEKSLLLALTVGAFGVGLMLSGIFPMDPMRGYPPGAHPGDPEDFSTAHRLHDTAGAAVFFLMPVMPAVVFFTSEPRAVRIVAATVTAGLVAGVVAFGGAWERDGALTGLIQKSTLVTACWWLAATFATAG